MEPNHYQPMCEGRLRWEAKGTTWDLSLSPHTSAEKWTIYIYITHSTRGALVPWTVGTTEGAVRTFPSTVQRPDPQPSSRHWELKDCTVHWWHVFPTAWWGTKTSLCPLVPLECIRGEPWCTLWILSCGEQIHRHLLKSVPQCLNKCGVQPPLAGRGTLTSQCSSLHPGCTPLTWETGDCLTSAGGSWLAALMLSVLTTTRVFVSSRAKCFSTFSTSDSSRQFMRRNGCFLLSVCDGAFWTPITEHAEISSLASLTAVKRREQHLSLLPNGTEAQTAEPPLDFPHVEKFQGDSHICSSVPGNDGDVEMLVSQVDGG